MLARRDPFRELTELNETYNRFFDQFWNGQQLLAGNVPIDVTETEEGYHLKASLPGLYPEDLDITLSNNVLTIKGEVKLDQDNDSLQYHIQERWSGPFQRSLKLPAQIVVNEVQANYEAGVLSLFLPKSEEVKPKRIQINAGAQPKMIEGQAE